MGVCDQSIWRHIEPEGIDERNLGRLRRADLGLQRAAEIGAAGLPAVEAVVVLEPLDLPGAVVLAEAEDGGHLSGHRFVDRERVVLAEVAADPGGGRLGEKGVGLLEGLPLGDGIGMDRPQAMDHQRELIAVEPLIEVLELGRRPEGEGLAELVDLDDVGHDLALLCEPEEAQR